MTIKAHCMGMEFPQKSLTRTPEEVINVLSNPCTGLSFDATTDQYILRAGEQIIATCAASMPEPERKEWERMAWESWWDTDSPKVEWPSSVVWYDAQGNLWEMRGLVKRCLNRKPSAADLDAYVDRVAEEQRVKDSTNGTK